jgi:hypothetical protein
MQGLMLKKYLNDDAKDFFNFVGVDDVWLASSSLSTEKCNRMDCAGYLFSAYRFYTYF